MMGDGRNEPFENPSDLAAADDLFLEADDVTPLSFEEREGLKPTNIVLRRELNEAEQLNILAAEAKLFARKINPVKESFGRALHKKMFGDVWKWAGHYRISDKNIGISRAAILPSLYKVYDDTAYWVDNETFPPDEVAVRFHHALVVVHPFPNGNGRWSRLMADLLLHRMGRPRFSAGRGISATPDAMRTRYIAALRSADRHEFSALLAFMRS